MDIKEQSLPVIEKKEKPIKISHRNEVRQFIPKGGKKSNGTIVTEDTIIWHAKKFNAPQYADLKQSWKYGNTVPKPSSKRQTILRIQENFKCSHEEAKSIYMAELKKQREAA